MLSISAVNVGRESVFDPANENLASCKIKEITFADKRTKVCIAESINGYSYYARVIDLKGTKWAKDNEISFHLNLQNNAL